MYDLFGNEYPNDTNNDCLTVLLEKQKKSMQEYQETMEALANCPIEQRRATPLPRNYIGERIQHLLELNGLDITSFCQSMNLSRSTLHRYLKGTHLPSKKTLHIIIEGLWLTPEEFASHLDDFEVWKWSLDSGRMKTDIFAMCENLREELNEYDFTYTAGDGTVKKVPQQHYKAFCNLFDDAVSLLRLTLK